MVPNLPYFMVQFDYKGERGYGHVIEGTGDAAGGGDDPDGAVDEGEKGGGEFPRCVALFEFFLSLRLFVFVFVPPDFENILFLSREFSTWGCICFRYLR